MSLIVRCLKVYKVIEFKNREVGKVGKKEVIGHQGLRTFKHTLR